MGTIRDPGPALLDTVTARQGLSMPPHVGVEQATGFGLWLAKAVLNGQGSEMIDVVRTHLFHIIFPTFTVGLAAWLAYLQACSLILKTPVYDRLFSFWLRIFGVAFGLGVVSGIIMAFQFGTNWSELSGRTDPGAVAGL